MGTFTRASSRTDTSVGMAVLFMGRTTKLTTFAAVGKRVGSMGTVFSFSRTDSSSRENGSTASSKKLSKSEYKLLKVRFFI